MTRINTNVSSLVAQKTFARSHDQLQTALTRLSTGLRINVGKDDPAGLIASEVLRSDIISVQRAISNSQRANQLIGTADSALGQASALLNDVRGLVSEAANTGALSEDQIKANQLQIDSSLEAIDRIAQTTSFQGRRLLDGSLDFITSSAGTTDLKAVGTFGTGSDAFATVTISGGVANSDVRFTAQNAGAADNGYSIFFTTGAAAGSETASIDTTGKILHFTIDDTTSANDIVAIVGGTGAVAAVFTAVISGSGLGAVKAATTATTAGGADSNTLILTATTGGTSFNNLTVSINTGAATGAETATYATGTNTLTVTVADGLSTAQQVAAAIVAEGTFNATAQGTGLGTYSAGSDQANVTTGGTLGSNNLNDLRIDQANFGTASSINVTVNIDAQATQGKLIYSGGTLTSGLVLEVGGEKGFDVFNFGSGTNIASIAAALNLGSDATGVSATVNGTSLELTSTTYGSKAFVSAKTLSGSFATFDSSAVATTRKSGTDVAARINGNRATGEGLKASINTSTLDLSFSVSSAITDGTALSFSITGGGATFQLGPDVVSNQQARLGIQGVSTATLGGVSGKLYELRSGGGKDLHTDVKGAAAVVDEVITSVTGLRGRLGAFQKTTLETNIFTLSDTLQNLTDAESTIRDADFAVESAALTRAQILVQSGTSVLQIANQNPQNVLALLRG